MLALGGEGERERDREIGRERERERERGPAEYALRSTKIGEISYCRLWHGTHTEMMR